MAGLTVTYEDGSSEQLTARAAGLVAAERKYKGTLPPVEGTFYACWYGSADRKAGGSFEAWLDRVVDYANEEGDVTPPPPAASPES